MWEQQPHSRSETQADPRIYVLVAAAVAVVFLIDVWTIIGVVTWIFYLIPLSLCLFGTRPGAPLLVALVSSALIVADYFVSPSGVAPWISQVNRAFGMFTLWVVALQLRWLIASRIQLRHQAWLRNAQALMAERVRGEGSMEEMCARVLELLTSYIDAQVGAVFVRDGERLDCVAMFCGTAVDRARSFAVGEGLVGQVAASGKSMCVTDVPRDYVRIASGIGAHGPSALLLSPAAADGTVVGIVELATFHAVYEGDIELLALLSEPLGIAMRSQRLRMQREELLYETQQQAEELQAQQEELRVANEELEEQSRALRESQASLEAQQAELEQTNVQLEEHTQLLARQNHALSQAEQRLREQTEELARSNQYKSEFLANMSHELRTPLNSALILAKLLADNKAGNLTPEQVAYAQNIYSANNDLLELINDILDLSKVESGKAELRFEEVEVRPLIEAVAQLFGPLAAEKGIPCSFDVDPDVAAHMITDAQRLRQILKNLLSNAIKFTDRGQVALTVHKAADDRIAFAVRDTGVGIAPDQQEIIFEPFRQADGSTHRKHRGTGLGLSISRELAGLLGGTLELQSALGKGSTFTLQLPVSAQQTSSAPAAATHAPAPAPARIESAANETPFIPDDRSNLSDARRVLLVVEDDPAFAKILLDLAHTLDFHCLVARTADEGFAMALEFRPAAIVLDIGLPDHTGLTVLDRLKHNSATRHIPVQVVSASDYTQTALAMGAAGYLIKPVAYEQLEEALAKLQSKVSARARTVLVVEDNAIQRDSICELLASQDVRTVAVDTAAAALQQLQQTSFDCMVLDLALPDASGYQLLETMAGQEQYSFPPVIVYTGRSLSPTQEQQLRRYSRSIIIKGARSPERLLDEVTLFLHQVETTLPSDRQRMLRVARDRESVLDGKRVLIVEDDVRNIFALSRVLEPCGLTLVIARNGLDALAVLNQQSVDLVLMDIMMPEMDGLEATRRIRAQAAFAKLPIIALTAKAMPDDQQRCLEAGANDYITKPIDVDKLLSLMRIWLN